MEADSKTFSADGAKANKLDYEQYYKNVRAVHQDGAFGSIGYRYPFNDEEPERLVLRTHTTAVSTYCLHRLAATSPSTASSVTRPSTPLTWQSSTRSRV
jgi:phenylalanyl-tRNA synthetase alpha chain